MGGSKPNLAGLYVGNNSLYSKYSFNSYHTKVYLRGHAERKRRAERNAALAAAQAAAAAEEDKDADDESVTTPSPKKQKESTKPKNF